MSARTTKWRLRDGRDAEFEREAFPPEGLRRSWAGKLRFRVIDDADPFFCPWLNVELSGYGGGVGYAAAAFSKTRLAKKLDRLEDETLASLEQKSGVPV